MTKRVNRAYARMIGSEYAPHLSGNEILSFIRL